MTAEWKLTEDELCEASDYVGITPSFKALLQNVEKAAQTKLLEYLRDNPPSKAAMYKEDFDSMLKEELK